jgi:type II secretory pathway component PulK
MKIKQKNHGSVFLITLFVVAMLSAVVMGMLQMTTEEIQLMRNQIWAAQALCIAEAGLNDALSELRTDSSWSSGFTDKNFNNGSYTTTVSGSLPNLTLESTGTSPQGYAARVLAEVTVASSGPPYVIRIDELRINE